MITLRFVVLRLISRFWIIIGLTNRQTLKVFGCDMLNTRSRFAIIAGGISAGIMIASVATLAAVLALMDLSDAVLAGLVGPIILAAVILWRGVSAIIERVLKSSKGFKRLILGERDLDGIWLQAEAGTENRIAVIAAISGDEGLEWKGYVLDKDLRVVAHIAFALTNNAWPAMLFKFFDSIADEGQNWRHGSGEIQFERGFKRVQRFTGVMRSGNGQEKRLLNGHRITKSKELRQLQTMDGRAALVSRYWEVFFPASQRLDTVKTGNSQTVPQTLEPSLYDGMGANIPFDKIAFPSPQTAPIAPTDTAPEATRGEPMTFLKAKPLSNDLPSDTSQGVPRASVDDEQRLTQEGQDQHSDAQDASNAVLPTTPDAAAASKPPAARKRTKPAKKSVPGATADRDAAVNAEISEIESQLQRARAAAEDIAVNTLRRESEADAVEDDTDPNGRLSEMRSRLHRRRRS